ncbi:MAG: zinc ribbon domain-containing protein [Oscillospiraceae bacterium]|nr:zinc ribbon domain-containing protein [Oscillospiraceae bacterium]
MFCEKCGATLRENAKFCPECGITVNNAGFIRSEEYSYETTTNLFPWNAVIPIIFAAWLPFTGIGVMVALAEGFWFVPLIMSGVVLLAIFLIAWAYKGKQKKWGKDRTLWIITPEGWAGGYPPDVAKRLAALGAFSTAATIGRQNWGVTSQGINMAKNIATVIHGLPVNPWENYIKAEYRPQKREIALHKPTGNIALISTNSDNYSYVEQLVRLYMGKR